MIRMLLIGYCLGIRSDAGYARSASELAYRWFCRLGLARSRTIRLFPRTGMDAFARATFCASSSN